MCRIVAACRDPPSQIPPRCQKASLLSVVLTCRLSALLMFALGSEMATLVTLVFSNHLASSSTVSSLSSLSRFSTWKGIRSTRLALPPHRGASRTCTMFPMSSWRRYKPEGQREEEAATRSGGQEARRTSQITSLMHCTWHCYRRLDRMQCVCAVIAQTHPAPLFF